LSFSAGLPGKERADKSRLTNFVSFEISFGIWPVKPALDKFSEIKSVRLANPTGRAVLKLLKDKFRL
jgi:hypothetical protein